MLTQEVSIAYRIRTKLDAGELPRRLPPKLWAGFGSGLTCDGCEEPILNAQVEYQVEADDRSYRFHLGCSAVWRTELLRREW